MLTQRYASTPAHVTQVVCALILIFISHNQAYSHGLATQKQIGVRGGVPAFNIWEDIDQYEVFFSLPSHKIWQYEDDWLVTPHAEVTLGQLKGNHDTSGLFSVGPKLLIVSPSRFWEFNFGLKFTYIDEYQFEKRSFGGNVQLIAHLGVAAQVSDFFIGYRFQHMSNAGIYDENPGLDLHMLEIGYRF